ncbi:hypothetical protein GGQ54_001419 [Naumannella cuiyingiana]|uniref:Uncharacterized protein n=1 Tax=Naumannella cuiyingiana TaxID=1347891 RepID=A0A7Z0D8F7_9ACTN|nr:hypothetical protein [Naumannella cuiyingiana]NYI70859.1 hypothetical protein [Naumannella cuiyingiana]
MSNITNLMITLYAWNASAVQSAAHRLRQRREAGQGALEYVGMVAVAALIVIAIIGMVGQFDIGGLISTAIAKVKEATGWEAK